MVAVGEDLVLIGQVRTARIDQIDAGKRAFLGDFLRPQVFFHGHRVIGAAFDRRVIGDDHDILPHDATDPRDHARAGGRVPVHAMRRRRADFQKRAARVQQVCNPFARRHFPARDVTLHRFFSAPRSSGHGCIPHGVEHGEMGLAIGAKAVGTGQGGRGQLHAGGLSMAGIKDG